MESDRTNTTSADGVNDLQQKRPLHGRTSGPTRRSTKGQWTSEEDEILRNAVQHFKGKNWKKIAECFKDRTDVQCLHRWQKVLNPELVKGPWSKEEDEVMIQLVNKYGPKKWSTIAQHLPGRIGKQCRERWHNHLNPAINKDAWTHEEELALIRAHQIYGNKWAELSKFLPGRTDNAIKNHWNSSVKKKLDSYLASGLLEQFQGLPHVSHIKKPMPSSSTVQQCSGDDSLPKDRTEAEEISECSQGSTVVGCSQSTSDMANPVVCTEEDCRLTEEYSPEVPCELGGTFKFLEHNFSHDWVTSKCNDWQFNSNELPNITSKCNDWQFNSNELPNISSPDLEQESSGLLHCMGGNENQEMVPLPLQTSVGGLSASTSMGNMIMVSDKPEDMLIYPEAATDGPFPCGNLSKWSNIMDVDGSTDSLLHQSLNYQFNDLSPGNQEEKLLLRTIYTNDSSNCPFDDDTDRVGLQEQPDEADSSKLVPADDFGSGQSNNIQNCPSNDENPAVPTEKMDSGALFYEPPRFPSLDVPFFSCDLIQSSSDMHQEYSPLGIRQLMMSSSMNCFSPFKLCDSPSRDDSPDAVLKSAAKTFTYTPSILKKRHRDLVSPLSEKQREKRLESDRNQETLSNFTRDFSRLEVMFDVNGNQKASCLSPSSNQKRTSVASTEDKENLGQSVEVEKNEGRGGTALSVNGNLEKGGFDSCNTQDKIKHGTVSIVSKTKDDADAAAQTVQKPSGVLVEHKMNDQLFFSPDCFGIKSDSRATSPSARNLWNQYSRGSDTDASNQGCVSEFSTENPCLSSVISPSTICRKNGRSHFIATTTIQSATSSAPLEIMAENSGNEAAAENLSMFGETPFKRSIESPSAWKSPWFVNSFIPGPGVDTNITIEDIGYFMSPGDRSYDAIGLMKHLSEHTAATFADAQEVLGDETPDTILKKSCSNNEKAVPEEIHILKTQEDNRADSDSNILRERRILDFSECETPPPSGRFSTAISFPSPSSYLLKGCR